MNATDAPPGFPVLLFDGACGLCQRVLRVLLWLDRGKRLHFAPLQGEAGQAFLREVDLPTNDFDSLVFVPDWQAPAPRRYLRRTEGALQALRTTGRWGRWLGVLRVLPGAWRDAGYRLVARWRYRLFGAADPGRLRAYPWGGRLLP